LTYSNDKGKFGDIRNRKEQYRLPYDDLNYRDFIGIIQAKLGIQVFKRNDSNSRENPTEAIGNLPLER
jgi:hypothetical protein